MAICLDVAEGYGQLILHFDMVTDSHLEFSDHDFVEAFELLTLKPDLFVHEAHVRLAWLYFKRFGDYEIALEAIENGIRKFDFKFSTKTKYHHTITIAFAQLIFSKMKLNDCGSWQEFMTQNPMLLDRKVLLNFYSEQILSSEKARTIFVKPDKSSF